MNKLVHSVEKAARSLWNIFPMLLGVILLIGLAMSIIPKQAYSEIFSGTYLDIIIGSVAGSILAGNPVTSYVLGGEFLEQGVSIVAVTAFLTAWVTVGVVTLPAEISILGKRFALARNISAFILSMLAAIVVVTIIGTINGM